MLKTETIDALKDDELRGVIAHAEELLKTREEQRKKDAIEKARSALAAVGLSFKDVAGKLKAGNGKGHVYKSGTLYQHPVDKTLSWNGKGQKPNWIRQLEAEGKRPLEVEAAA